MLFFEMSMEIYNFSFDSIPNDIIHLIQCSISTMPNLKFSNAIETFIATYWNENTMNGWKWYMNREKVPLFMVIKCCMKRPKETHKTLSTKFIDVRFFSFHFLFIWKISHRIVPLCVYVVKRHMHGK